MQALSKASVKHQDPHCSRVMLVRDRNLITENYADAGRATLLEFLDWTLKLHMGGNKMHFAVKGVRTLWRRLRVTPLGSPTQVKRRA